MLNSNSNMMHNAPQQQALQQPQRRHPQTYATTGLHSYQHLMNVTYPVQHHAQAASGYSPQDANFYTMQHPTAGHANTLQSSSHPTSSSPHPPQNLPTTCFPYPSGASQDVSNFSSPNASASAATPIAMSAAAVMTNPYYNINLGSKLFVGQVPAVCTEEQLRPVFEKYGPLLEVKVMREHSGRSKGSAWVRFEKEEHARLAIEHLNEKCIIPPQINPLRVQFATPTKVRTQPLPAMAGAPPAIIAPQPAFYRSQPQPQPHMIYAAQQPDLEMGQDHPNTMQHSMPHTGYPNPILMSNDASSAQ